MSTNSIEQEIVTALDMLIADVTEGDMWRGRLLEYIRAYGEACATAQRERDAQTVSALHCPECRAGQTPAYDEYWRAYYHGTLLCLGSPARRAIRGQE